jgi:hypothetical protein
MEIFFILPPEFDRRANAGIFQLFYPKTGWTQREGLLFSKEVLLSVRAGPLA